MERITIYHNPACGASCHAMERLKQRGVAFETIEYLKHPPSRETLESIIAMLDGPIADLVRKDKRFKELNLDAADYTGANSVVALLLKHPELMQRPIVIRGKRAIIARPPEKLDDLL